MERDLKQMQDPLGLLRLGYADPLLQVTARFWHDGAFEERTEQVVEETPVVVVYNTIPHVVMMATPLDLEDFAMGFSVTEELIRSPADLERIQVVKYSQGLELQLSVPAECEAVIASRTRRLAGRTGCGICGADSIEGVLKTLHQVPPGATVPPNAIERAFQSLIEHQRLNAAAGTVHAAGWASLDGSILLAREDVGRHNALDKLIGALLRAGTKPENGFIVVTSRASFEMAQKATAFGAGLLAAISGPTGLAVRVAQQAGLTLVGLARPGRMTVYTHPERIDR
jgi:formate dehydrogenase accessory protein FdhD